ncbi:hypothetical protein GCK72_005945 [Caenorhabditis remanei]|uniref:C2H2-type domain-containing protein n=1 Tax=Caenorhabditis remanei TaxID=31234 RepID=A0A6A5HG42_CAERE|nr:hypothetical protein GCK72_005945 [Caenorhabditis remanei]KAF1765991.1 hypothetical protein GCK72_005945 [Caenorhabditis remanei]
MISSFQNSGMMAFESAEIQLPRKDFGKKSSNLEQSIQKIKVRKSLLMAEICSSNKEKDNSKNEENNKPKFVSKAAVKFPTAEGLLPPGGSYICDECKSDERTPFQLCEHKAIYHCPVDQRVWRCVYCNTTFGRRGGLRRHVQMVHMQMMHKCPIENCPHPGYKCTKALNAHIRTHTRPYACDRCDAAYARKNDLQNHQLIHNNQLSL